MRVDGKYGVVAMDNMMGRPQVGTEDWHEAAVVLDVPEDAVAVSFGALLVGAGTLWVDDFVLEAVGKDVAVTGLPVGNTARIVTDPPTEAQVAWLRDTAESFATVEAGHGLDDLSFVKEMVGDARIVGLGECTHGSREVFQCKHRLLEYLVTELGFSIFSIEASTPEAYRLNDYVLHGEGDPAELIGGMYFWTWNTEEVLAMVEWMRAYNASGRGPVQFTGFDMQYAPVAMDNVIAFLQDADPDLADLVTRRYQPLRRMATSRTTFGVETFAFPVDLARGKSIAYRGHIKCEDVDEGFAGLWWRIDGPDGQTLGFDNMHDRGVTGTRDWQEYVIEMDVPAEAKGIYFGVILPGTGKAWFDDLRVDLDGEPCTAISDLDLDFEGDELRGIGRSTDGYANSLTAGEAVSGRQSLLIENTGPRQATTLSPQDAVEVAQWVLAELERRREAWLADHTAADVDWALHNARIVQQCQRMKADQMGQVRDASMAENVKWILEQNPGARIVLWAHNGHIARQPGWMGSHLDRMYGDDYLPVGFATNQGTYYAMGSDTSDHIHELQRPDPGSIESFCLAAGLKLAALDLRRAESEADPSGWVHQNRPFRGIGAMAMDQQFAPIVVADEFDVLIYIDETTAAHQLSSSTARGR